MLRSSLTLALRTLSRRLGYTAVNAIGLTVGLACCALVAVFLEYELTYDTHHADADRVYRIVSATEGRDPYSSIRFKNFGRSTAEEQRLLADGLVDQIPAVEQAAAFAVFDDPQFIETADGDRFESDRQLLTNTGRAFADLFTFERLAGPPLASTLHAPGSAVLTASAAQRYFGTARPIGRTVTVGSTPATVRAVIDDPPPNSRLAFDVALRVDRIPNWAAFHYVRLAEGTSPDAVAPQVTRLMNTLFPDRTDGRSWVETLQALPDIHFAERALYDAGPHRNPAYLWIFGAIGGLILVITTINYANLALVLSAGRNAEIGVRKAVGGHRGQIARQFLVESVLLALLCVPPALGGCAAALPLFNALMDTGIPMASVLQPAVICGMVLLAICTGLAAGGYPALVMARTRVVALFDRGLSSGSVTGWSLRHGLIGLQFAVLIVLGSLSWIASDQLRYMQGEALGYATDTVVRTNFSGDSTAYQQFRQRLAASSAVAAVGMGGAEGVPRVPSSRAPFQRVGSDRIYPNGASREVDMHWFDVMGIEHPVVDAMKQQGPLAPTRYLINEAAADLFQVGNPSGVEWNFTQSNNPPYPIDGILPRLHLNSMRQTVDPTLYEVTAAPSYGYNVLVRLAPGRVDDGLNAIRSVWPDVQPDTPLRITFLEEEVANLYAQERRFGTLATVLSGLAILMAVMGLASLVAYLTRLRRREIGIRKALGGSTRSIVTLLNREYVQIVGAAFIVSAPLAWWAASEWLSQFAYRVDVSIEVLVGTGAGALLVAVAAVSLQAVKAAQVDPAVVLRSE